MFRILVVDDTPANLEITSRMLQKSGYGVDTAHDGETGVEKAGLWRYDLIVMDMNMPGLSGSEAARHIRDAEKVSGTRRVPIIAFTANSMEDCRQSAMRGDMDDFIVKPIEKWKLLAAVERSLDGRMIVLVADDCTADRERTRRYLRALDGVGVIAASNADDAVAACGRQRISLALVNIAMKDAEGIETAQKIRNSAPGQNIGIIVVSESIDPAARQKSADSGYTGYLEKPFTQPELLKAVSFLRGPG